MGARMGQDMCAFYRDAGVAQKRRL
jgi:hypothetical protein